MLVRLLVLCAVLLGAYMTFWFVVGKRRNRLNTVDVAWPGGFVLVAWTAYALQSAPPTLLIAVLVSAWGARLMLHLYRRVIGRGSEDPRYEAIRAKWRGNVWLRAYFSIFLLQGALILLISLPIIMAGHDTPPGVSWAMYGGAALWLVGFSIERQADAQLAAFVQKRSSGNDVMDSGLWRYSRHPNYFGELLQWWAISIIALPASYGWVGLLGPLTLTVLIVFVSGIPPIERRKQANPAYAEYMRRTSQLIPLPPKS